MSDHSQRCAFGVNNKILMDVSPLTEIIVPPTQPHLCVWLDPIILDRQSSPFSGDYVNSYFQVSRLSLYLYRWDRNREKGQCLKTLALLSGSQLLRWSVLWAPGALRSSGATEIQATWWISAPGLTNSITIRWVYSSIDKMIIIRTRILLKLEYYATIGVNNT